MHIRWTDRRHDQLVQRRQCFRLILHGHRASHRLNRCQLHLCRKLGSPMRAVVTAILLSLFSLQVVQMDQVNLSTATLNAGSTPAEAVILSSRVGVGIPVPYFTPNVATSVIALDLFPSGSPA